MNKEEKNKIDMLNKIKQTIKTINKIENGDEEIEFFENQGDIKEEKELDIGEVIETKLNEINETKKQIENQKKKEYLKKYAEKRKEKNALKKNMFGAGFSPKQSKFPTRSDYFLYEPMRALSIILNHKETEIYKDGVDPCPRILMGHRAYGNTCKRNAFEHLANLQKKLVEYRGDDPNNAPPWILISNDTSFIMDRNILTRLEELKPTTGVAAAYGFEFIRKNGRWFEVSANDQDKIRGSYIQGNLDNVDWDYVVGSGFKLSHKYRILIASGPFIAVRGNLFMTMDFKYASENYVNGFWHYMADISLQCYLKNINVATIKTHAIQYDNLNNYIGDKNFEQDHVIFLDMWEKHLPASIHTKPINPRIE